MYDVDRRDLHYDVFVSYRREGGEFLAMQLYDRLEKKGLSAFFDVESMRSGPFDERLLRVIEQTPNFIIVCTVNSLDRCGNEGDWVRRELAHALEMNKNVIPVLARGFHFPESLPNDISAVRHMNGIRASTEYMDAVIDKLCSFMEIHTEKRHEPAGELSAGDDSGAKLVDVPQGASSTSSNRSTKQDTARSQWAIKYTIPAILAAFLFILILAVGSSALLSRSHDPEVEERPLGSTDASQQGVSDAVGSDTAPDDLANLAKVNHPRHSRGLSFGPIRALYRCGYAASGRSAVT